MLKTSHGLYCHGEADTQVCRTRLHAGLLAALELRHDARALRHGRQVARRHGGVVPLYHPRLQALPVLVQPQHRVVNAALQGDTKYRQAHTNGLPEAGRRTAHVRHAVVCNHHNRHGVQGLMERVFTGCG